jgi:small conductance mechanosensitive channel
VSDEAIGTLDNARAFAEVYVLPAGMRVAIAVAVFIVGRWVARALLRGADRVMERSKVDISVRKFLGSMLYALMVIAIVVASLDTVGVRTTAIVAVIGAAGITIGLALQGSLSNFAAGVVLIMSRPYKVSDLIVIGKYLGRVDAIKAFNTVIVTPDDREVTLPNALVLGGPIENLTVVGRRRIDLLVTIEGDGELEAWKQLLLGAAASDARAYKEPAPAVDVAEVTQDAVKLRVRTWTAVDAYAPLVAQQLEALRAALRTAGCKFALVLETPVA